MDNYFDSNITYSEVDIGDCEKKLIDYYHLPENTELFILGIDSPNKDIKYTTSVYNYGIYLENGTLLDHSDACKDSKISISSAITNTDLIKLDKAYYFSDLGYDIYNENSSFYTDNCASASIDGNDITLEDRKKDFFPQNISLCNDSCYYTNINFTTKRFTCECDITFNFSQNISNGEENIDLEEDISYLDYFLSLINYKITVCYDLFFDFKSYYYNAGFYIAVGTLIFVIITMFVFLSVGIKDMNIKFLDNSPNKKKLIDAYKEQEKKREEMLKLHFFSTNYPPKRKFIKISTLKKNLNKNSKSYKYKNETNHNLNTNNNNNENNIGYENELINESKNFIHKKRRKSSKLIRSKDLLLTNRKLKKNKTTNNKSVSKINKNNSTIKQKQTLNNKDNKENINITNKKEKNIKENNCLTNYIVDEQVTKKEINNVPYTQALRIDKRNYFEIFLSVLAHEIEIVDIFYYRNKYMHLSIILSIYIFELCLDLTLNCLLYTDDVVSEKYNNNGSIEFFTSLSLSFMSNIFASIIAFIVSKLADYSDFMELIINEAYNKKSYFSNIIKFKKYLSIKLTAFYIIQIIINLCICYYLMIFCTVYHKTQGSIMVNYIIGILESMTISISLTIIISFIRFLSIKYKCKSIYNTSKYFFEKF